MYGYSFVLDLSCLTKISYAKSILSRMFEYLVQIELLQRSCSNEISLVLADAIPTMDPHYLPTYVVITHFDVANKQIVTYRALFSG